MKIKTKKAIRVCPKGNVLIFVMMAMVVLTALGIGILSVSRGARLHASRQKAETIAMLAAEAGYEKAIFWMSRQEDIFYVMKAGGSVSDSIQFQNGRCDVTISMYSFMRSRPAYRIVSTGYSGQFSRIVDVIVLQEIGGWDMGMCRVPQSSSSTTPVYFAAGEVIDMPIHINQLNDNPDNRDIYISGDPQFLSEVTMGESQRDGSGYNKYAGVINLFQGGIRFDQPESRITDSSSIATKIQRFRDSTLQACRFTPRGTASLPNPQSAVQIEFGVMNGVGKIRVTNNCTVRGFRQSSDSRTWDYCINGNSYSRYPIYAYHMMPSNAEATGQRIVGNVEQTYVTQSIAGMESEPGGQIYVDGNVIIGGDLALHGGDQVVKGRITIVATGNIWIADSIHLAGPHDANGMPTKDNPNALGLIAGGVIRVVDPGMADYGYVDGQPRNVNGHVYVPIGRSDPGYPSNTYKRYLPDPMIIEASLTVGGGGFGAENVARGYYGGRKEANGSQDDLTLRGTISEAIRGVVGLIGSDGYLKQYLFDPRFREGILPGDVWLRSKYVPAPAGWRDYTGNGQ